ncbi:hypothetical protein CSA17_04495 [bacterium DOLJORAL78_65_58]|nr:MAG: hypothetical protein CSB20_08195 [bacterium DOLZORAL124_64_63]PIE76011.1 MAG: hypothetical protein CSA17_04495 [bacterium DOLJORAL78_65_58]
MKYLLFGAGTQGTAIAHDLLRHAPDTADLMVVDRSREALDLLRTRLDDRRLRTACLDVSDTAAVAPHFRAARVAISAVDYWHNAALAAGAVAGACHFLDLGGNNEVVEREFALDAEARAAGVSLVPDCGLAPGLVGILGYWLVDGLDKAENLKLRVGGLPVRPQPPMNYKIVFSVQGLINECIEPAVVIRNGRLGNVPPLSELETLVFPEPFGELEAFQTSGGTSTLPRTLLGRVPFLDYKTIRYKGHCAQFRLLHELGLTDHRPRPFRGGKVSPRQMLAAVMQEKLDLPGEDVVLLRATAEGWDTDGQALRHVVQIIDHHDGENGISAMMRMTGYPTAIIAWLLASGEIDAPGAREQERIVPGERMIELLRQRGVAIEISESHPGKPV